MANLLPYVFVDAPVRPLEWVTPPPTHEVVHYADGARDLEADVYRPGDASRHAALLLSLGVHPAERSDPALVTLASGVARDGLVVLVPESPDLRADRILPSEIDAFVAATRFLTAQPYVDAGRIGFAGFSAGASLLLVSAADPRVAGQVRAVNFFGGYDDASLLLREVATRSVVLEDGRTVAWEPDPLARTIFADVLLETVDDPVDRAVVARALVDGETLPPLVRASLGARARYVHDLFTAGDPDRVDALLAAMPRDLLERLQAISPDVHVGDVRAKLFLMHDVDDRFVPVVESRRLAARVPQDQRVYTEFDLFAHVEPTRRLDPLSFAGQVWKLARHLYAFLYELS